MNPTRTLRYDSKGRLIAFDDEFRPIYIALRYLIKPVFRSAEYLFPGRVAQPIKLAAAGGKDHDLVRSDGERRFLH